MVDYNDVYLSILMNEMLAPRPLKFVSFFNCFKSLQAFSYAIKTIVNRGIDKIIEGSQSKQNLQFSGTIKEIKFNIIFEFDTNEDDTLASFNPLVYPYELCINLKHLNINGKEDLIKYINSIKFQTILAHEVCHFQQTLEYGQSEMKKSIDMEKNIKNYQTSPIELESCVFMVLENAKRNNVTIKNLNEFNEFVESLKDDYLNLAKTFINNNPVAVKAIFENNELLEHIDETIDESDVVILGPCIPVGKRKHVKWW